MRRYGPIVAIVVVIAIIAVVVVATRSSDDKTATERRRPPRPGRRRPVRASLSFTQAKAEGKADSIDWGDRCDTDAGQAQVPELLRRRLLRAVHR